MAKAKEIKVEDKLKALYKLQLIDSKIDKIRIVRGELPLEVQDLEDDVTGLQTRIDKINEEISDLDKPIPLSEIFKIIPLESFFVSILISGLSIKYLFELSIKL